MKTFLITGYTFKELNDRFEESLVGKSSEEARKLRENSFISKLIEKRAKEKVEYDYDIASTNETQAFEEDIDKLGYNDANVVYSGFSSQGDGLCFDGDIDVPTIIDRMLKIEENNPFESLKSSTDEALFNYCIENIKKFNSVIIKIKRPNNLPQSNFRRLEEYWDDIYLHEDEKSSSFNVDDCNSCITNIAKVVYEFIKNEYDKLCSDLYSKLEKMFFGYSNVDTAKEEMLEEDNIYYDKYGYLICNLETNDIPSIDIDGRKNPSDPNGNVLSLNIIL